MTDEKTFLNAQKSAQELASMYSSDPRQSSFNLLLLGEMGSGKSFIARTARKPVLIHSFDPGGTKGLRPWIDKGEIVVDSRYESENPMKPTMFPVWQQEMDRLQKAGVFDHFGTFIIDSSTMWSEMIMNDILRKAGVAGQPPRWAHDYMPQKTAIRNFIRTCLDLPCDFILTGHLEPNKDEVSGQLTFRYATTGKGTFMLPTLFDEVWVMDPKDGREVQYRVLTQSTGRYTCRSRLSKDGKLEKYETPDIKHILNKAGMSCEDKPLLTGA